MNKRSSFVNANFWNVNGLTGLLPRTAIFGLHLRSLCHDHRTTQGNYGILLEKPYVNLGKEESASFFEKKEAKKLGAVPDPMIIALP
jgi:hypothetical protein